MRVKMSTISAEIFIDFLEYEFETSKFSVDFCVKRTTI